MKHTRHTIILFFFIANVHRLSAQVAETDTTKNKTVTLSEVVISVNKTEETKRTVAQQVEILSAGEIAGSQAQSTADLVAGTGSVLVQKSQQGGGSPVLRGFEASRILLVIDGVRMNNLIYRAGHLQDIIKTDNNSLERVEILFGPSSTIYGSDALGGVIHLYTKKPLFSTDEKRNLKANALTRYGSVNNEFTGHVDFNIGGKKLASLTSLTYSTFGDLKGGENQNPFYNGSYGERPYYVERFGNTDSLVKNDDRFVQFGSGYSQYDLIQKFSLKQGAYATHGLNIQYSNSSDVPRYDRLTLHPDNTVYQDTNALRNAEWYYGPQTRMLAAYNYNRKNVESKIQNIHFGLNYQALEESRHNRSFGSRFKNHRVEKVNVIGVNLDFQRVTEKHNIRFGADAQLNSLESTATRENIDVDTSGKWSTRYPDGDNTMNNFAAYWSHTWKLNNELTLTDGFRVGISSLHSTMEDSLHPPDPLPAALPFSEIEQNSVMYSGSIGIIHTPSDDLKLSFLLSTGFRVPNVDDVAKIFEPPSGGVIVPNPDLKPEQTINYEFGIAKVFNGKSRWENSIYYTDFKDIAVIDSFKYNGSDTLYYDGSWLQVYANQNKDKAYIIGFSSNFIAQLNEHFTMKTGLNYTYGRIKTETNDVPLDHIPPFMVKLAFNYAREKFASDFIINYSGWKRPKDYSPSGEDNGNYATPDGMPAWFTVNFRASYKVHKFVTLQAGVDNMFDIQYRVFASGINAPGRNVFVALRFSY